MNPLKEWLEWEVDWPFACFLGKMSEIRKQYGELMEQFLMVLASVSREQWEEYDVQIHGVVQVAAENDDGETIRRIYNLCPGLLREGYFDGTTPLGEAVFGRKMEALRALLECGYNPDMTSRGFGDDSVAEAVTEEPISEEMVFLLLEHGANLGPEALQALAMAGEYDLARRMMQAAKTIHEGYGPIACWQWIRDNDDYYKECYGPEEGLTETALAFLKELLTGQENTDKLEEQT